MMGSRIFQMGSVSAGVAARISMTTSFRDGRRNQEQVRGRVRLYHRTNLMVPVCVCATDRDGAPMPSAETMTMPNRTLKRLMETSVNSDNHINTISVYGQDSWVGNRRLTVNYGGRFERSSA